MPADEQIPVTEETRKELHELKDPGQTYDEFIQELTQQRRREGLEQRFRGLEDATSDELTSLEEI